MHRASQQRIFFGEDDAYLEPGLVASLCRFLRERLLPQDYASVSAFGRATDLTTDHEGLARVIERLLAYQQSLADGPDRIAGAVALPAVEDDRSIARIASDARVAIHVIRAQGLPGFKKPGAFVALEASMESKHMASLTGGLASIDQDPGIALARIDQLTRAGCLLACYPARG